MAVETVYGSLNVSGYEENFPADKMDPRHGGRVRSIIETVEVAAAASAGSKYYLGKIPSNAVILPNSKIHWDDLTATGAPTVDVGLEGSQITNDDNALADGLNVTAAGSSALPAIGGISNYGKRAWEFVSGQTTDPGGMLDICANLVDAAADAGGTITLELYYAER